MARKGKSGLDYFPMDIDFFSDEKIEFVSAKFGTISELIPIKLLMRIYRKGYFIDWDEDVCILFSKKFGDDITFNLLNDVVSELVKRDFFSSSMYQDFGILTSRGIQKRFLEATKRRKETQVFEEYLLLKEIDVNILNQNVNIISLNDCKSTQSKVKRKKRESKEKEKESKRPSLSKVFQSDSEEIRLSNFLFNHILKNNPNSKKPNFQKWAKDFDAILRIDKRPLEKVKEVIKWSQEDSFWKANILSPGKLRDKFDQLVVKSNDSSEPVLFSDITKQNIATGQEWLDGK